MTGPSADAVDHDAAAAIGQWDRSRTGEFVELCGLSFDGGARGEEDLDLLAFGDPSTSRQTVVLGTAAGDAAAVVTCTPSESVAQLQLVAVHPARRRRGRARAVVDAAEEWACSLGADTMRVGAAAPFYLFSGIDTRWTEALCLFESSGYERTDVVLDLVCPTMQSVRRARPPGRRVDHVQTDDQVAALARFSDEHYPRWSEEFGRAGESGTTVVAIDPPDGPVVRAAPPSVSRLGII
ncbi:hypothetical protein BH10ACT3_BH10ACT3_19550 [soil metagenome]